MRIGIFSDTYFPDINGVVSSIVTLQKVLEEHGHDVFIIANRPYFLQSSFEKNVYRLPGVKIKKLYGYVLTSPIHFAAYVKIRNMNLDLIHVHSDFGVGIFARIIGNLQNIPVVFTYHTAYEDYTHYFNFLDLKSVEKVSKRVISGISKQLGNRSSAIIAPSKKTKEMLLRYGVTKDIYVVPTGLDLEKFRRRPVDSEMISRVRKEMGIQDNECLIVFVGRIAKEKSIDLVINGFSLIDQEKYPCRFLIVGGGPEVKNLIEIVKQLNLEKSVLFTGMKPSEEIAKYYHAANVFVSASLTETQGLTFIEAMASELPVFARPDQVLENLVIEGCTGFYFETSSQLALGLQEYMQLNDKEKEDLKRNAKLKSDEYDSEIFYHSIMSVYEKVLSNRQHY